MTPAPSVSRLAALAAFSALAPFLQADVVELKNGARESGRIAKTDRQTVTLEKQIGAGKAAIPYPINLVAKILFEPDAAEKRLLASSDTKELGLLEALWNQREPFLPLPESDAAQVGFAYVRLLVAKGTKASGQAGVKIAEKIAAETWDPAAKAEAQRIRLSALAAAGKIEQALAEAASLEGVSSSDDLALAETQIRGRLLKADLALKEIQKLEEEWPKWELMPDLRKQRELLLAQAVDDCLFPVVFQPGLALLCAEGLWKSCGIFLHTGHPEEAALRAREIIAYYPVAPYQEQARKLVEKLEKENPALKP